MTDHLTKKHSVGFDTQRRDDIREWAMRSDSPLENHAADMLTPPPYTVVYVNTVHDLRALYHTLMAYRQHHIRTEEPNGSFIKSLNNVCEKLTAIANREGVVLSPQD